MMEMLKKVSEEPKQPEQSQSESSEQQESTQSQPEQQTENNENKTEDLVARVAKFTEENKPKEEIPEDFQFNSKDIEQIEDPKAREYALNAQKSFQKEYTKKFQELAELRKTLESSINKDDKWTPERVQAITQDPEFLQAAQQILNQTSDIDQSDDDSILSERERAEIKALKDELMNIKQSQSLEQKKLEDERLSNLYPNYNPKAVDTIYADMLAGKVKAGRNELWKVVDYESAIDRAYRLGRKDERSGIQEKAQAVSPQGSQVTRTPVAPQREEGQSNKAFWRSIMKDVLNNQNSNAQIKT